MWDGLGQAEGAAGTFPNQGGSRIFSSSDHSHGNLLSRSGSLPKECCFRVKLIAPPRNLR